MVHMPPRRTSLQVDVSRDLYIVCAFMYQGMPHQQAQAFTGPITHKKPYADCGAAFHCSHGRLLSALVSSMARRLLATTSRIRNEKEEKNQTKKNSPGYLSLSCASLGTWELPALSRIVVSSRRHRNLISRGANSLRPSLGCTCFRLDQLLASAS